MAFQPIVHGAHGGVFAYEALARGLNGESAFTLFEKAGTTNFSAMDEACRVAAIELSAKLGLVRNGGFLSINFSPLCFSRSEEFLKATIEAATRVGMPLDRIIVEITENESISQDQLEGILDGHRRYGFATAIDDFGAGFNGLELLSRFEPDMVKIDMQLTRGIHLNPRTQKIVQRIVDLCHELGVVVIAEGVENEAEFRQLQAAGIGLFQGYHFCKPAFEQLLKGPFDGAQAVA
jgi:EAL domain-containing protein (putative c-di-GMP-specific phosphodiesterase class I)